MTPLRHYVHATNAFGTHFVSDMDMDNSEHTFQNSIRARDAVRNLEDANGRHPSVRRRDNVSVFPFTPCLAPNFYLNSHFLPASWKVLHPFFQQLKTFLATYFLSSYSTLRFPPRSWSEQEFPISPPKWQILERPRRPNIGKCHRRRCRRCRR